MWDEQERFSHGVAKVFTGVLVAVGVASAGFSLALRSPAPFLAFLEFLGFLAAFVLVWALIMGGFLAVLGGLWALFCLVVRRRGRDA